MAKATYTPISPIPQRDQRQLSVSNLGSWPVLPSEEWSKHPGVICILGYANTYSATFKVTKFALFSTSFPLPLWHWEE